MYKKEIPETAATTTSEEEAPTGFRGNVAILTPWFWSLVFRVMRQFMPVVLSCPICWLQLPQEADTPCFSKCIIYAKISQTCSIPTPSSSNSHTTQTHSQPSLRGSGRSWFQRVNPFNTHHQELSNFFFLMKTNSTHQQSEKDVSPTCFYFDAKFI